MTDRSVQIFPPKYWGLASNQEKRTADADIIAREYWAFAIKLRDDEITKRGTMDPQCEKAKEGVYCKYTKADVEAFGAISSAHLEEECVAVDNGVSCFYPNKTVVS